MRTLKIGVERYEDGFVAHSPGLNGVVVGQGESYEVALADCRSAIRFHVQTSGPEVLDTKPAVLDAFIADEEALRNGMKEKSKVFVEQGAEVYSKV